ncbi:MAG: hypothetical protein ABR573_01265 [Candidatus Dormibacteria bacterium]
MARLATAAGIAGILIAGAAPALAANNISYYSGNASAMAVHATVDPSAVLDVRLGALQSALSGLNAVPVTGTATGLGTFLNNQIGGTLQNATQPIEVIVDRARVAGTSAKGTDLTGGNATSTAVSIQAASLAQQVNLLQAALQDIPLGTVKALRTALAPIIAADSTGTLQTAFNIALPQLAAPVSGALGDPTVNLLQEVNVNFPNSSTGNLTTVGGPALLTPESSLKLQPFSAHAIPSDAQASNSVDNLALVPTGKLGVPSPQQLVASLTAVTTALNGVESALTATTGTLPTASVTGPVTNQVFTALNPVVATVTGTASTTLTSTDLSAVNTLINALNGVIDALSGLNGVSLNSLVADNGANAVSNVSRGKSSPDVTASSVGQVAHVSVLHLNDSLLTQLLVSSGLLQGTELVSVDAIKATANVTLGSHKTQTATGTLGDVKVLGKSLTSYVPSINGKDVSMDALLPEGTTCTINLPGKSSCNNYPLDIVPAAVSDALGSLQSTLGNSIPVPTLLTVTLRRGAPVYDTSGNDKVGSAAITVLDVAASLNCDAVGKIAGMLPTGSALSSSVDLHFAACGAGLNPAAQANTAGTAHTAGASHAMVNKAGTAPLADVAFGVAAADLTLDSSITPSGNPSGPLPPTTGNDVLILAGLALAALAGGVALQVRKARA